MNGRGLTTLVENFGAGNPKIIGFDHSKQSKFAIKSAVFSSAVMATQLGATPITGVNTNITYTDTLTVSSNAATTTYTALGTAGSEIGFVYLLNSDGSLGQQFTQAATPVAGKFSYTAGTKALAFFAGDITTGTSIVCFYKATSDASAVTVTSYTDLFAKNVKLVANTLVRDTCTGVDYKAQIIFNKAKISNMIDFTLTADGAPAVHSFEAEALKSCGSTKLWDLIVYTSLT